MARVTGCRALAADGARRVTGTAAVLVFFAASLATTVSWAFVGASHGVGADAFTSGSVALSVSPSSAAVSFEGMAPGDRVTAPLTVGNDGTLPVRYSITSTATNADSKALAGQLDLTIKSGVTTCSGEGFANDGTVVFGPADLGSVAGVNIIGDPTPDLQGGERILNAADREVLCMQVMLPRGTGDAFQGSSTVATFTIVAEPIANHA